MRAAQMCNRGDRNIRPSQTPPSQSPPLPHTVTRLSLCMCLRMIARALEPESRFSARAAAFAPRRRHTRIYSKRTHANMIMVCTHRRGRVVRGAVDCDSSSHGATPQRCRHHTFPNRSHTLLAHALQTAGGVGLALLPDKTPPERLGKPAGVLYTLLTDSFRFSFISRCRIFLCSCCRLARPDGELRLFFAMKPASSLIVVKQDGSIASAHPFTTFHDSSSV